jgi:hypothetical protein
MAAATAARKSVPKPAALSHVQLMAARATAIGVANSIDTQREALRAQLAMLDAEHARASKVIKHIDGRMKGANKD